MPHQAYCQILRLPSVYTLHTVETKRYTNPLFEFGIVMLHTLNGNSEAMSKTFLLVLSSASPSPSTYQASSSVSTYSVHCVLWVITFHSLSIASSRWPTILIRLAVGDLDNMTTTCAFCHGAEFFVTLSE